jgi:predicted transcriptional regulator
MEEISLKILRYLHKRWWDVNATPDAVKSKLKLSDDEFNNSIEHLLKNEYVSDDHNVNNKAYRITAKGSVTVYEADNNKFRSFIKCEARILAWALVIVGGLGLILQCCIGHNEKSQMERQLQLQERQLELQEKSSKEQITIQEILHRLEALEREIISQPDSLDK